MTTPEHVNPTNPRRKARAPYNFVPLPERAAPILSGREWKESQGAAERAAKVEAALPGHDRFLLDRHSGRLRVTLKVRTPLFVRGPLLVSEFEAGDSDQYIDGLPLPAPEEQEFRRLVKNIPYFFNNGDRDVPVIPGSSLRGMLRAIVEIAAHARPSRVDDRRLVYRAVGDPSSLGNHYRQQFLGNNKGRGRDFLFDYPQRLVRGGYLKQQTNGWSIQPARKIQGETFVHVEYDHATPIIKAYGRWQTHQVFVQPVARAARRSPRNRRLVLDIAITPRVSATLTPGLEPAVLVESGHMGGRSAKHWHCAIFEADSEQDAIPIPDELWNLYVQDRDMTRGIETRKLEKDGDALFYLLDDQDNLVFFGPTQMFRIPYSNGIGDLIPEQLGLPENIDLAEGLFGFVRTDEELQKMNARGYGVPPQGNRRRAYAGRVQVGDAMLTPEAADRDWRLADVPLVPQILGSPKPTSFQMYLTQTQPDDERRLNHYDSQRVTLRGFKRYWPQGESRPFVSDAPATSSQHTQMQPVKPGATFHFDIRFQNLTDVELGALCWAVEPTGQTGKYVHQLGMGKPLGMGTVALKGELFLTPVAKRYASFGSQWDAETETTEKNDFLAVFEKWVLEAVSADGAETLGELSRIEMLLQMMAWREPTGEWRDATEYMRIGLEEGASENEYRRRPVLPDPLAVAGSGERAWSGELPEGYYRGVVVGAISDDRGFGFIQTSARSGDVFVHRSQLRAPLRSLSVGERVIFRFGEHRGREQAQDVYLERG